MEIKLLTTCILFLTGQSWTTIHTTPSRRTCACTGTGTTSSTICVTKEPQIQLDTCPSPPSPSGSTSSSPSDETLFHSFLLAHDDYSPQIKGYQKAVIKAEWDEWLWYYDHLTIFINQTGKHHVPLKHPSLGAWAKDQRAKYRMQTISKAQQDLLNRIGFSFLARPSWRDQYDLLCKHCEEDPTQSTVLPSALSRWVQEQRQNYRRKQQKRPSPLTAERIQLLQKIHFQWEVMNRNAWDDKFQQLCDFHEIHNHTRVPYSHPELGIWVSEQRRNKKKLEKRSTSPLTQEKMEKLEQLGFEWNVSPASWETKYQQLRDYFGNNNHSRVPFSHPLGRWVHEQRQNYKRRQQGTQSPMTDERIALLETINFQWTLRKRKSSESTGRSNAEKVQEG